MLAGWRSSRCPMMASTKATRRRCAPVMPSSGSIAASVSARLARTLGAEDEQKQTPTSTDTPRCSHAPLEIADRVQPGERMMLHQAFPTPHRLPHDGGRATRDSEREAQRIRPHAPRREGQPAKPQEGGKLSKQEPDRKATTPARRRPSLEERRVERERQTRSSRRRRARRRRRGRPDATARSRSQRRTSAQWRAWRRARLTHASSRLVEPTKRRAPDGRSLRRRRAGCSSPSVRTVRCRTGDRRASR